MLRERRTISPDFKKALVFWNQAVDKKAVQEELDRLPRILNEPNATPEIILISTILNQPENLDRYRVEVARGCALRLIAKGIFTFPNALVVISQICTYYSESLQKRMRQGEVAIDSPKKYEQIAKGLEQMPRSLSPKPTLRLVVDNT